MLSNNMKVRFAEKDFVYAGITYNKGSLVILGKGNENKIQSFLQLANQLNNKVTMGISKANAVVLMNLSWQQFAIRN